ncbi:MAG: DUF1501 domain-containing protein [Planctomycetaceae bacterium]|nr:DUF1501 domain-containing protein [Planctomycetaceae bacterium]
MRMPRRSFLGLGVLGGVHFAARQLVAAPQSTPAAAGRARQVLIVLEQGGVSHVDTWDPKPETAAEHRSPYKPIDTSVPGIQFTELLTNTARHADKLAIVRSMTHAVSDHGDGTAYFLQGVKPRGPIAMPDIGAALSHVIGSPARDLPPYVMIPGNGEQSSVTSFGFLSPGYKVFKTGGGDLSEPSWRVNDLGLLDGINADRFRDRRDLLSNLDVGLIGGGPAAQTGPTRAMDNFFERAFHMLDSPRTKQAFDLTRETAALRDEYGPGHRGQCYLLGRRLIEAGIRTVVLDVREPQTQLSPGGFNMNWDHHDLIYASGSCGTIRDKAGGEGRYGIGTWQMMGSTDRACAALLGDMHERGLLAETLVCFVTEFGRTPRLNQFQGRDHWPNAFSIAFAGAGVRGGQVIGKTDRDGGYVLDQAYTPDDYAATVYSSLGVDLSQPVYTRENRPVFLVPDGRPIARLF